MIVALTLSLTLVNPTCTAKAESRDLQFAINKARHELMVKGCDLRSPVVNLEEKVYPNGVTTYIATVTVKESK